MIEITSASDLSQWLQDHDESLVQFATTWCGPCRVLKPHMEMVSTRVDFPVGIIYVDTAEGGDDVSGTYTIEQVPLVLHFKGSNFTPIEGRNAMAILKELE